MRPQSQEDEEPGPPGRNPTKLEVGKDGEKAFWKRTRRTTVGEKLGTEGQVRLVG